MPKNPADELRAAWDHHNKQPFMDWVSSELRCVVTDISDLTDRAVAHYKASGVITSHHSLPPILPGCLREYTTLGSIELEAFYMPGRIPSPFRLRMMNAIVKRAKDCATQLLLDLFRYTYILYGTPIPTKGWPSLLRAAARGYAIV